MEGARKKMKANAKNANDEIKANANNNITALAAAHTQHDTPIDDYTFCSVDFIRTIPN